MTRDRDYLDGLTAFRFDGDPVSANAREAVDRWLQVFVPATIAAAEQAADFAHQLSDLHDQWLEQLATCRAEQGTQAAPAPAPPPPGSWNGSPSSRCSPSAPCRTSSTSPTWPRERRPTNSPNSIVSRRRIGNTTGYFASDVFELLTIAERRLASTRWDTREAPPNRPVPALPADDGPR